MNLELNWGPNKLESYQKPSFIHALSALLLNIVFEKQYDSIPSQGRISIKTDFLCSMCLD